MMIWEDENNTREKLLELRRTNVCAVCGGMLNIFLDQDSGKAFLACNDYLRTKHEGIMRPASEYEKKGLEALTINSRREVMEQQYGEKTSKALAKLPTSGVLTQPQAMHILKLVYPDVPEDEIIRCAILCRDFGLHPLMKEVYIIGFTSKKTGKKTYSTVIGIGATRKMSSNKGTYSYLDDTPRVATHQEIVKQYGEDSEEERDNLVSICKLKGDQGNESIGFGLWPKETEPYGVEKGNTKRNMANIRSERQAHDRLSGTVLPQGVEVIDERYAPSISSEGVEKIGEIAEGEGEEEKTGTTVFSTTKPEPLKNGAPAAEPEGFNIDMEWLKDTLKELKWTGDTAKSFLVNKYKVSPQGILEDVIKRLTREQAEEFVKTIQERATQNQPGLFD